MYNAIKFIYVSCTSMLKSNSSGKSTGKSESLVIKYFLSTCQSYDLRLTKNPYPSSKLKESVIDQALESR